MCRDCVVTLQGLCYWGHARSDETCHADGGQTFLLPRSCSIDTRAIVCAAYAYCSSGYSEYFGNLFVLFAFIGVW